MRHVNDGRQARACTAHRERRAFFIDAATEAFPRSRAARARHHQLSSFIICNSWQRGGRRAYRGLSLLGQQWAARAKIMPSRPGARCARGGGGIGRLASERVEAIESATSRGANRQLYTGICGARLSARAKSSMACIFGAERWRVELTTSRFGDVAHCRCRLMAAARDYTADI